MKISLLLQLSFITMLVVFLINSPVYGHCLGDQKALLLKLKNGLTFDSSRSTKLVRWSQNTDCCQWPGVSCDQKGHALVLELDKEAIFSGLENPTSLFDLQYLNIPKFVICWFWWADSNGIVKIDEVNVS